MHLPDQHTKIKTQAINEWFTIKCYQQACVSSHSFLLKFLYYYILSIHREENSQYIKPWL